MFEIAYFSLAHGCEQLGIKSDLLESVTSGLIEPVSLLTIRHLFKTLFIYLFTVFRSFHIISYKLQVTTEPFSQLEFKITLEIC